MDLETLKRVALNLGPCEVNGHGVEEVHLFEGFLWASEQIELHGAVKISRIICGKPVHDSNIDVLHLHVDFSPGPWQYLYTSALTNKPYHGYRISRIVSDVVPVNLN